MTILVGHRTKSQVFYFPKPNQDGKRLSESLGTSEENVGPKKKARSQFKEPEKQTQEIMISTTGLIIHLFLSNTGLETFLKKGLPGKGPPFF